MSWDQAGMKWRNYRVPKPRVMHGPVGERVELARGTDKFDDAGQSYACSLLGRVTEEPTKCRSCGHHVCSCKPVAPEPTYDFPLYVNPPEGCVCTIPGSLTGTGMPCPVHAPKELPEWIQAGAAAATHANLPVTVTGGELAPAPVDMTPEQTVAWLRANPLREVTRGGDLRWRYNPETDQIQFSVVTDDAKGEWSRSSGDLYRQEPNYRNKRYSAVPETPAPPQREVLDYRQAVDALNNGKRIRCVHCECSSGGTDVGRILTSFGPGWSSGHGFEIVQS